jgi:hypothetical protein
MKKDVSYYFLLKNTKNTYISLHCENFPSNKKGEGA